jgi:uncharacterized membrane protein (Fun14 family)
MAHHEDNRDRSDPDANASSAPGTSVARHLPPWKKKLIGAALAVAVLGGAAQIMSMVRDRAEPTPTVASSSATGGNADANAPGGSRGFVLSPQQQPSSTGQPPPVAPSPSVSRERALWEKAAPYVTKFGVSFLAGIIIGLVFRAFVKTMAFITALLAIGLFCLSYFHIFNFDSNQVRQSYEGFSGWAKEHALALKDVALHALPSGTLGLVGFFAGFKRH